MSSVLAQLAEPFPHWDLEWRILKNNPQAQWEKDGIRAGCVAYITSRAVQDRLDTVVGPPNWQTRLEYRDRRVMAGIGIREMALVGDAGSPTEWVWKWDGSDVTRIEEFKGGVSQAIKRAGALWGIARYLYYLELAQAQRCSMYRDKENPQRFLQTIKGKRGFWWDPPILDSWALPGGSGHPKDPTRISKLEDMEESTEADEQRAEVADLQERIDLLENQ